MESQLGSCELRVSGVWRQDRSAAAQLILRLAASTRVPPGSFQVQMSVRRQNCSEKSFLRDGTSARFELCRSLVDASWCEEDNTSLLASGSADGFVKVWDTRTAEERPVASLSSMTAVSQVQWRRQSDRYIASTHGGDVRLWDIRDGTEKRQNENLLVPVCGFC